MYCYVYDHFLADRKFETELSRIEARLFELGIQGRIERLTLLKSFPEIVKDGVKKGCTTLVVVGNDETVSRAVSFLSQEKVTLGLIPLGEPNRIATLLGIPQGVAACDVLSKRIIERLDLGRAGSVNFLTSLDFPAKDSIEIECNDQYSVRPEVVSEIRIINVAADSESSNPQDGVLEAVVSPVGGGRFFQSFFSHSASRPSVFPIHRALIRSRTESIAALADGQTVVKTPFSVEVLPRHLKVIVGKRRRIASQSVTST